MIILTIAAFLWIVCGAIPSVLICKKQGYIELDDIIAFILSIIIGPFSLFMYILFFKPFTFRINIK